MVVVSAVGGVVFEAGHFTDPERGRPQFRAGLGDVPVRRERRGSVGFRMLVLTCTAGAGGTMIPGVGFFVA